jgi:hypothetical protein
MVQKVFYPLPFIKNKENSSNGRTVVSKVRHSAAFKEKFS